jgi:hypothetical protein
VNTTPTTKKRAVFLGSTANDLHDVRAELIKVLLSLPNVNLICFEKSFIVSPGLHTHDVCLENVKRCDLYLLIISERYGSLYEGSQAELKNLSVTQAEVRTAINCGKHLRTFVRNTVWLEKATYTHNKKLEIAIEPYYARDIRVFDFLEFIATQTKDNWIEQFQSSVDLKQKVRDRIRQL